MKLHPRVEVEQRAHNEIEGVVLRVLEIARVRTSVGGEISYGTLLRALGVLTARSAARDEMIALPALPGPVAQAIEDGILKVVEQAGLTHAETTRILATLTLSYAKYPVRIERHGNREDARADLAYD